MDIYDLFRDSVSIEKLSGETLGPVKGLVQKGKIQLQAKHPLEPGDILVREMPFGEPERYVVNDPGFMQGIDDDTSHFQAEVTRESKANGRGDKVGGDSSPRPAPITYIVSGAHARFNQNSTDNSINVTVEAGESLFEDLKSELRSNVTDPQRLDELLSLVSDMQASQHDSKSLSEKLGQFISKSADIMTIIAPFVPALTGLATGAS
ncbi:hypothetical protein QEN58_05885 [Halomonas alkaliantarctica]|uniref:Uncharacterized protein n=1 Tax=Halomonas alkaliantarctica TaxID=232346 RepID=A0ABY8LSM2_9GAMM|nr:hypothetical protein [Halomonas alkaliantarctica]WGI26587.1 hypothetical protein QEN58_05885 [Halomonas alkaliantarctica]